MTTRIVKHYWAELDQIKRLTAEQRANQGFHTIEEFALDYKLTRPKTYTPKYSLSKDEKDKDKESKVNIRVLGFKLIKEDGKILQHCLMGETCSSLKSAILSGCKLFTGDQGFLAIIMSNNEVVPASLAYKALESQLLFVPGTLHTAVQIIRFFYNNLQDPFAIVQLSAPRFIEGQTESSVLFTYYISCLSYALETNALTICHNLRNIGQISSHYSLFKVETRAEAESSHKDDTQIDKAILFFHAVFFCYSISRQVPAEDKFTLWARRRYNALASALSHPPQSDITLALKKGGDCLMKLASERKDIKTTVIYAVSLAIDPVPGLSDAAKVLASHIRMLTMFAGASTLNFIMQIIHKGGAALALQPVANQLLTYAEERAIAMQELKEMGFQNRDNWLPYYKLLKPDSQLFTATKYADIITVIKAIDIKMHGKDSTMSNYQYNKSMGVLDERTVVSFLEQCREMLGLGRLISKKHAKFLSHKLGIPNFQEILSEARHAMGILMGGGSSRTAYDSGNESADDDFDEPDTSEPLPKKDTISKGTKPGTSGFYQPLRVALPESPKQVPEETEGGDHESTSGDNGDAGVDEGDGNNDKPQDDSGK